MLNVPRSHWIDDGIITKSTKRTVEKQNAPDNINLLFSCFIKICMPKLCVVILYCTRRI